MASDAPLGGQHLDVLSQLCPFIQRASKARRHTSAATHSVLGPQGGPTEEQNVNHLKQSLLLKQPFPNPEDQHN